MASDLPRRFSPFAFSPCVRRWCSQRSAVSHSLRETQTCSPRLPAAVPVPWLVPSLGNQGPSSSGHGGQPVTSLSSFGGTHRAAWFWFAVSGPQRGEWEAGGAPVGKRGCQLPALQGLSMGLPRRVLLPRGCWLHPRHGHPGVRQEAVAAMRPRQAPQPLLHPPGRAGRKPQDLVMRFRVSFHLKGFQRPWKGRPCGISHSAGRGAGGRGGPGAQGRGTQAGGAGQEPAAPRGLRPPSAGERGSCCVGRIGGFCQWTWKCFCEVKGGLL